MDETVGKLLDALDARYGKDGWSLVLSADHGGPPMPERNEGAQRIDLEDVQRTIKTAAGDAKWIVASDERNVWLSDDASEKVKDDVVAALARMPGIGFAMRTDRFAKGCAGLDGVPLLVCESVFPGRSGDVYYGPREHSFVMHRPFEADYHGTPYDYDRHAPLIVREPGRAARVVDGETPSILRVAPTVARLLGAPPPPAAHEPSL
jgi:arylsulfatase A-like enzyme